MERSKSYSEKSSSNNTPAGVADLRCYSASYVSSKKTKSATWPSSAASPSPASASGAGSKARIMWSGAFGAPAELRRKRRVTGYRLYAVEGRVKGSLKSGVRWLKGKCTQVVHGLW